MKDPFGSMQGFMGQFQGFMKNPMQNPNEVIQYLMNNGKLSQQQYNQLQNVAKQIQSNPQFQQFMQGMQK